MTVRALVDSKDAIPSVRDYGLVRDRYSLLVSGRCHDGQELTKTEQFGAAAVGVAFPRLTGFEFLRRLRRETAWPEHTPRPAGTSGATGRNN